MVDLVGGAKKKVGELWDKGKDKLAAEFKEHVVEPAKESVTDKITEFFNGIVSGVKDIINAITEAFQNLFGDGETDTIGTGTNEDLLKRTRAATTTPVPPATQPPLPNGPS